MFLMESFIASLAIFAAAFAVLSIVEKHFVVEDRWRNLLFTICTLSLISILLFGLLCFFKYLM